MKNVDYIYGQSSTKYEPCVNLTLFRGEPGSGWWVGRAESNLYCIHDHTEGRERLLWTAEPVYPRLPSAAGQKLARVSDRASVRARERARERVWDRARERVREQDFCNHTYIYMPRTSGEMGQKFERNARTIFF